MFTKAAVKNFFLQKTFLRLSIDQSQKKKGGKKKKNCVKNLRGINKMYVYSETRDSEFFKGCITNFYNVNACIIPSYKGSGKISVVVRFS